MRGTAIALFVFSALAAASTNAVPPPLGRLVDAGGYRVHLYCTGTGSPTIMVVGGAFSFDWGLIQPEVAKFTRICTYDPSGTAWSDPFVAAPQEQAKPLPRCKERVLEIHRVLQSAEVPGPYVLVGFSIGGLTARLYTHEYPDEVAGVVLVDHAFINVGSNAAPLQGLSNGAAGRSGDHPPVLIFSPPITLGLEDDQNFRKLPQHDQDLHTWAMSINPLRPTAEMASECFAAVDRATGDELFPFAHRPLIVIRTANDLPAYEQLQEALLRLSRNSKLILAANSSHMVIIDEPGVVTRAIREVINAVNNRASLK